MSRIYVVAVLLGVLGGGLAGAHEAWSNGLAGGGRLSSAWGASGSALLLRADGALCASHSSGGRAVLVCNQRH